jgi:DNA modification methylase
MEESKKTGKKKDRAKRKLKRSRLARREKSQSQPSLFPQAPEGKVELLKPTAEEPALRRYIPAENTDHAAVFERLHIVDLREPEGRKRCRIRDWGNRIVCGDAAASLALVPDESAACVVTSPPYWNTVDYAADGQLGRTGYEEYLAQLLEVWRECERVLIPNGKLCINAPIMPISKKVLANGHTRELKNLANDIERTILDRLALRRFSLFIWQKQTTEKMFGSYPYPPNLYEQNTVEFINVFVKPGKPRKMEPAVKKASRLSETEWMDLTKQVWWMYPEDVKRAKHPAPFPEILPNRLIAMYTFAAAEDFPGDVVLDPFCGTGATCAAAKRLGRRYLGIDLGPDFCVESARRVRDITPDGKVALSGPRGSN